MEMKMSIKPIKNRVLIKPEPVSTTTASGLHLPGATHKDNDPFKATVVAIGNGDEIDVAVGDIVIVPPHSGAEITHDGEKHFVVESGHVLAIIEG